MKQAWFIAVIVLVCFVASALAMEDTGDDPTMHNKEKPKMESEEEKFDRMKSRFEQGNFINGVITVSFTEGTSLAQAKSVLQRYGLSVRMEVICPGAVESNPGDPQPGNPESNIPCVEQERWNENLRFASVEVARGEELAMAIALYNEPNVIWVEPDYASVAGGDTTTDNEEPTRTNMPTEPKNNKANYIIIVVGLVLIVILWKVYRWMKQ